MLSDPRAFPALILVMYALAMVRYCVARNWPQALYWLAAFTLTYLVTFVIPKGP